MTIDIAALKAGFESVQDHICRAIAAEDGQPFMEDAWTKPDDAPLSGSGRTRILEGGGLMERAGVGFSHVRGRKLPPSATQQRPELAGRPFEAIGVSLVFHPHNPHVPTVHANIRAFVAQPTQPGQEAVWWFGGGMDLTPYYPHAEDARHFHQTCANTLAPFGSHHYPAFKQACDDYFFLKHRQEARGIGGIFFDDFTELGFERSRDMCLAVGRAVVDAYLPIVHRRRAMPYGERERDFQALRRGRYVEFNLVYDRGTLFGLQSGGRSESILMSMPPKVQWRYDWQPEPNSPEAALYRALKPRDWLSFEGSI